MDFVEPCAIYARISEDDDDLEAGVKRQVKRGTELADRNAWSIHDVYCDNDRSALHDIRPEYERLVKDALAGSFKRIIVMHTSRLWRDRVERSNGINQLGQVGMVIVCTHGPPLDLSTASGRYLADILGSGDTAESELKSERITEAAAERASSGRPTDVIPYGFKREYITDDRGKITGFTDVEHPDEAEIVREITDRILAGDSLRSITADLNARGIPAPGARLKFTNKTRSPGNPDGTRWGKTGVRKLALRPANAGLRLHHRGRPDETLYPGNWSPIVPRAKWDSLHDIMSTGGVSNGGRRWLLTWGVGECGICHGYLRVQSRAKPRPYDLYMCEGKGCVGRNREKVDKLVEAVMEHRLKRNDAIQLFIGDDTAATTAINKATELQARLRRLDDLYADPDSMIDEAEWLLMRGKLKPRIAELEAQARQLRPSIDMDLATGLVGPNPRIKWSDLPLERQRFVLETIRLRVIIDPTSRGPRFNPRSVRFLWPGETEPRQPPEG